MRVSLAAHNRYSFCSIKKDGVYSKEADNPILKQMELDDFKIPSSYRNCSGCGVTF